MPFKVTAAVISSSGIADFGDEVLELEFRYMACTMVRCDACSVSLPDSVELYCQACLLAALCGYLRWLRNVQAWNSV